MTDAPASDGAGTVGWIGDMHDAAESIAAEHTDYRKHLGWSPRNVIAEIGADAHSRPSWDDAAFAVGRAWLELHKEH